MSISLDKAIQGGTIPEAFEGTLELSDISGVALSLINTVPLLRLAVRQQYVEDALERLLPAAVTCLARHANEDGRRLRFAGNDPADQQKFLEMVVDPWELLDPDLRIMVKLSSSLPRDAMNEATLMMNAQRMTLLDKYTTRSHLLRLFDLGVSDPDEIQRRVNYEQLQDMLQQQRAQQMMQYGQQPQEAMPVAQPMFPSPGLENEVTPYSDEVYQRDVNNAGPLDSMINDRSPGMRFGMETADNITGRGQTAVTNPLLARRQAAQFVTRTGALQQPFQPPRQ